MRPNEPATWWKQPPGRPPTGMRRFKLLLPPDVENRLRAVADHYGIRWTTLASAIVCEWVGRHAPYRVRRSGEIPWWDRRGSESGHDVRKGRYELQEAAGEAASPIRARRKRNGLSLKLLALYAGVSDAAVRRLERGGPGLAGMRLGEVVKIADALGCSALELLPGLGLSPRAWRKREAQVRPGENPVERGVVVYDRLGEACRLQALAGGADGPPKTPL